MSALWQDLRYGLRRIGRQPGFASLAIVTLALGIGATTIIFSVIEGVLLDPFPYLDADRVVSFQIHDLARPNSGGRSFFQPREFLAYQQQSYVFEEVIGSGGEDVFLTTPTGTEQYGCGYVTPNLFHFLGVPALLGRGLAPDDGKPGAPPVFVMSYKMWLARHGLDPSVLGRTYVLDGVSTTLVGIMPPRFTKLAADLWRPASLDRIDPRIAIATSCSRRASSAG
jgi:hypothetical protein